MNNHNLVAIKGVFENYPSVMAVYLFGSMASGKTRHDSDIDLGVIIDDSNIRPSKLDILTQLVRVGFENVDLVFVDPSDIVLLFEVVRHNKLLFKKDEFDSGSFFSLTVRRYFDFLPYLDVHKDAYKTRQLHG